MSPRLSQVFLNDARWIDRLVSRVKPARFGVEWAAGRGALTQGLVDRWDSGLALELDQSHARSLGRSLDAEQWLAIRADLLNYPLPRTDHPYPLVGNLPYHLTGPALMRVLRHLDRVKSFQGLVQLEVARRLTARPGDSDYRGISLMFQWAGTIESECRVPADAFQPVPDVESAWVKFVPGDGEVTLEDRDTVAEVMFRMPRKTLLNNLAHVGGDKDAWRTWMKQQGWDPRRRPHTVTPEEFEVLYQAWKNNDELS